MRLAACVRWTSLKLPGYEKSAKACYRRPWRFFRFPDSARERGGTETLDTHIIANTHDDLLTLHNN